MNLSLKIFLILILLFQLFLIVRTIKVNKLSIRYGSLWLFLLFLLFIIVLYPNIIFKLSTFFGFETTSNMLFLLGFFFLYYINFILTTSLSVQAEKIKTLAQEVALLKKEKKPNGK